MRISQANGIVSPIPIAGPLMAAIAGLPRRNTMGTSGLPSRFSNGDSGRRSPRVAISCDQPLMSPPAQKARPDPVTTSTPTSRSAEAPQSASLSSRSNGPESALSFSGRLSVIRPTRPRRSNEIVS